MKIAPVLICSVALFVAACNAETPTSTVAARPKSSAVAFAAPGNGDWSTIVQKTPEGGYAMGNPGAKVKLVEFGSMTCHYCADFDKEGVKPLVNNYVKKGLVNFEFRNFVRDPFDLTATLLARCAGETGFFGLTRNIYSDQTNWLGKVQAADPARMQALQSMPAAAQFATIADLAGLKQFVSMRGLPQAKADQCLADAAEVDQLVQMNADAVSQFNVTGTPAFAIDGTKVDVRPGTPTWTQIEAALKKSLAS